MRITMVKKELASGEPCEKCAQAQEMLERRGHWDQIDEVVWAVEGRDDSPGVKLGQLHGVKVAPFFIVEHDDGSVGAVTSALRLIRDYLAEASATPKPSAAASVDVSLMARELAEAEPSEILRFGLTTYGEDCAIAFSGAEDVVLIDMATELGIPFRTFTLDSGRLRDETYKFLDEVRRRYGVVIEVHMPGSNALSELVLRKGQSSFLREGHRECCDVRKLQPLSKVLGGLSAWISGQRRDRRPGVGGDLPVVQQDPLFQGAKGSLVKLNPLTGWSSAQVWEYIREKRVPYNALHDLGFRVIDCEPCTRATAPDQPEHESRWWWEEVEERRSLLHDRPR
jgi:phosphoadenosine phosphosulfate reductase